MWTSSNIIRWSSFLAITTLTIAALWVLNVLAPSNPGWAPHAISHLTAGVGGMLVMVWVFGLRRLQAERFARAGRIGPQMLLAGAAWFAISQLVEALSAVIEYPNAGIIHTGSGLATMLGLLSMLMGAAVIVGSAVAGRSPGRGTAQRLLLSAVGISVLYVFLGIVLGF